jgi:hypothetical protein
VLLTLNQVISQITTLGAAHLQIQSTGVGDFAEWQALERAYPLLWVFHETTSIGDRELVYSIRLVCADRVITGEEGDDTAGMEQEVLSDTLLILLDFLAYFQQQHAQSYKVITSASIDPFTERFNDRVAGNSVLIQIRQPFTWDACQIPQTGATIPPSVDGLTLYDFCDPSVIARLTPSQVACLEAEYGVDATVTQNGNAFFTVPAGATYPLVTKLDGANSLGSFNAGTKTLSFTSNPSNLQINGAQSEIIPGNSTFNLLAKLDGVAGGVYNAGLDTLNFTTTPAILQRNAIQIKTLANASTFNLITKLDGAANNGTWDGVDTLDFTSAACSPVTFQVNAVNKESLSSGTTFNLITKLDGAVNSGTYDAPTDTLSFTSAPTPSVSLALSDSNPFVGDIVTLTATPTNFTPTSYQFRIEQGTDLVLIVTQVGNTYNWTVPSIIGTYTIYVLTTDGSNNLYKSEGVTIQSNYLLDIYSTNNITDFATFRISSGFATRIMEVRRTVGAVTTAVEIGLDGDYITLNSPILAVTTGTSLATTLGQFVAATGYANPDSITANQSAFVVRTYKQRNGALGGVQTTAVNQPRIVNAGVLDVENGIACLVFSGNQWLDFGKVNGGLKAANYSLLGVGRILGGGTTMGWCSTLFGGANALDYLCVVNRVSRPSQYETSFGETSAVLAYIGASTAAVFDNTQQLFEQHKTSGVSGIDLHIDGSAALAQTVVANQTNNNSGAEGNLFLGAYGTGGFAPLTGSAQMMIAYNANQTSNRVGMKALINIVLGTSW